MSSPGLSPVPVAVFVRLRYPAGCDADRLQSIADGVAPKFTGVPGLRSKAFTCRADAGEAVNVYLWRSEADARAMFSDGFVDAVESVYGVRPDVEFARLLHVVDNGAAA